MLVKEANEITGGLSKPSKMPGYSYNLPAKECQKGAELAKLKGSTCADCYALKGRYRFPNVQKALYRRLTAIKHPRWVEAMAFLINRYADKEQYFRWHDSGDLQSLEHLKRIVRVAKATNRVIHWLPTREYSIIARYRTLISTNFPRNLTVRLSAWMNDSRPESHQVVLLNDLPTSTVSTTGEIIQVSNSRKDSILCRASARGNKCGSCRACWSKEVKNVNYPAH